VEGVPTPINHESNNKSFALHACIPDVFFFEGREFSPIKKVLCEKKCTKIIRFKKDFFSDEIAIFRQ